MKRVLDRARALNPPNRPVLMMLPALRMLPVLADDVARSLVDLPT